MRKITNVFFIIALAFRLAVGHAYAQGQLRVIDQPITGENVGLLQRYIGNIDLAGAAEASIKQRFAVGRRLLPTSSLAITKSLTLTTSCWNPHRD